MSIAWLLRRTKDFVCSAYGALLSLMKTVKALWVVSPAVCTESSRCPG